MRNLGTGWIIRTRTPCHWVGSDECYRSSFDRVGSSIHWPVFFKRGWSSYWPFLVGFAMTGTLIVKLTAGLTWSSLALSSLFHSSLF
ncbi:hypothetical protein BHM03_00054881 [Ensete ventricosum]|uniref:Uncharacterized protein n=1 Tax=Ensete ventricosum TaxID=4639 RepID=A0A426YTM9_ENSVE|nr:hypothetical protein B296_00029075 [Ensete ventricosum]RZS22144.1 hypothetical protein BHM03_00054881 [Ensete ventricosum]